MLKKKTNTAFQPPRFHIWYNNVIYWSLTYFILFIRRVSICAIKPDWGLMHFDNVFQFLAFSVLLHTVVIWCTLTMSFSSTAPPHQGKVLWFDALWQCLSVREPSGSAGDWLWFDALWQCLSVMRPACAQSKRLWFDALWQCLSVAMGVVAPSALLWFDALWQCLSVNVVGQGFALSCDLMHFDYVFQYVDGLAKHLGVVIWCTLTMSFSLSFLSRSTASLWFDALWQCLSVNRETIFNRISCDLMHFDNVFQWIVRLSWLCWVVIWCTLTMSFSTNKKTTTANQLWFDALWQCLSVDFPRWVHRYGLWFDALWQCLSVNREIT